MTATTVHASTDGSVVLLRIDRPETKNALAWEQVRLLHAALDVAIADGGTRALVITGSHGDFCSGADIADATDPEFARTLFAMLDVLRHTTFPTLAAVDGYALGAGMQLALACDLRVATPAARFGIPAGKLGLMIDHWTARRLADTAGQGTARAILLGGEVLSTDAAIAVGLVQRPGSVDDALRWAQDIAALAPITLAGHKRHLAEPDPGSSMSADHEAQFWSAWSSNDVVEGVAAFRDRRPPEFTGT